VIGVHDFGHFHTHDEEGDFEDFSPISTESVTLHTVGIDIGSSTSHLIFSRLVLQREGKRLSSRFVVVEREVIYVSPIYLTPYKNATIIDTEKLKEYFEEEYNKAGQNPDSVDTGAVIVTGEAAMKENAGNIISMFAAQAGKFVCASAGPNLEATLAAHGSGAVSRSRNKTVLNVDIGGGTTKFAVAHNGHLLETAAISIGARLMAWNEDGELVRVEKTAKKFMPDAPQLGEYLSEEQRATFVNRMSESLFQIIEEIIRGKQASSESNDLYITPKLSKSFEVDEILFSGGVAEFIYSHEKAERGDFGFLLGNRVRELAESKGLSIGIPKQRIRATVIGASQYTVQLSGNTIFLTGAESLPIRNVPVFSLDLREDNGKFESISKTLADAFQRFDIEEGSQPVALSVRWSEGIDYSLIHSFCQRLYEAMPHTINQSKHPLILAFDADVGGLVGRLLLEEFALECTIVSIDQVDIRDLDFIDIGEPLKDSGVVPVVIKSLVFK
jgi:ethanolamine utilization protein EutA